MSTGHASARQAQDHIADGMMRLSDLLADAVTEPAAGLYAPYMGGLGLRVVVRWSDWMKKRSRGRCNRCRKEIGKYPWYSYPWHDLKAIVTLSLVGAGVAIFWTGGFWYVIAGEYIPIDLSGVIVTRSMSVMVGYLLSLVVCRRLALEV